MDFFNIFLCICLLVFLVNNHDFSSCCENDAQETEYDRFIDQRKNNKVNKKREERERQFKVV